MKLTDLNTFQERKGLNKNKWVIYNKVTGNNIPLHVYNTEEEARTAIPTAYAAVERRRNQQQEAEAKREADRVQHETTMAELCHGNSSHGHYYTQSDGGRVYRNQPGAVHYDDGTGSYSTQVWDNA